MANEKRGDGLLDTREVARILGVHVQTVRRYIRAQQLPAIRLTPRHYKVHRRDLDLFLATRRTVADGPVAGGAM